MLADLANVAATRALQLLPPEPAHRVAIGALRRGLAPGIPVPELPRLATTLFGRRLAHPLGLAAGFDKNAEGVPALFRLGFSFVEVGTITPQPQAGNPRPRLFRLRGERALINRLGFNSHGLEEVSARLAALPPLPGPIGANIGMNREVKDPIADYVTCLRGVYEHVDYMALNVSSPNTPGLRRLQSGERLEPLLDALVGTRAEIAGDDAPKPLLVKIAPDLSVDEEADIARLAGDKGVDGLIVCNTTLARPPTLHGRHRNEAGGLSGPPLAAPSTELLRRMYRLTSGRLPLIGVGGIASGADALAKIRAGACALQLYTALVYDGPGVVGRILFDLDRRLERAGHNELTAIIGADA